MSHWPKDDQTALIAFYGTPGHAVEAQLVDVVPPFRMTYEGSPIARIRFHKKAAAALLAALTEIWEQYGKDQSKIDALGISHYDGAYNPRFIRGSTTRWSNHAFGAAIDINADHNGFNTGHGTMPKPVVDAFKRQGARWGGDYHGRTDPMHFEFCDNGQPDVVDQSKPAEPPPRVEPQPASDITSRIVALAAGSDLAHFPWRDRGRAPLGYIKGMAVAFAAVLGKLKANDPAAVAMARQNTNDDSVDAISWFNSNFRALGMTNDVPGVDVLRHLFVMLTGLGMRESSGKYCEGRDRSANNVAADTAEAGLFQMSWNAHSASPLLMTLFQHYDDPGVDGLFQIFREGVIPNQVGLANFGSGPGARFQELCKTKPLFAVESAALGLRVIGGQHGQWGPIRRKEVELRPEADKLFRSVQEIVGP